MKRTHALSRLAGTAFAVAVALSEPLAAPAAEPDDAAPLKVHMIAFGEYDPVKSLTGLKEHFEKSYKVEVSTSFGSGKSLENLDRLAAAEVLFVFARRMQLPEDQMKVIRAHWDKGKPIVGVRTASHAFQKADNEIFDRKVFGGNYGAGTFTSNGAFKPVTADGAAEHPVLKGVGAFRVATYAYPQGTLAEGVTLLQFADTTKGKLPVTWVNTFNGGRTFYTSAGAPDDFSDENFRRMLTNAVFWTAKRDSEKMRK